jgi:hypothetical protein
MTVWSPRQIATQNIDSKRYSHANCANPEAPIAMHAPPIRPWSRFTVGTAVSFWVVLASSHCFSISDE